MGNIFENQIFVLKILRIWMFSKNDVFVDKFTCVNRRA